jgi:hypothetical protein
MKRAVFALLIAVSLLLGACADEPTVEQQIIAAIRQMEEFAENGERASFMGMVAGEFDGQLGSLSKFEFQRLMIMQWNRNSRLHAQLFPISVRDLGSGLASAEFNALITGGRGLIPKRGEFYAIKTQWIKEDGDWLLLKAEWVPKRLETD